MGYELFERFLLENKDKWDIDKEDAFRVLTLDVFAARNKFEIPDRAFYLFYHIGDSLFSGAHLYSPDLADSLYFAEINPKKIVHVAKLVNKITSLPLVAVYETERFQIPDLMVFEKGTIRKSRASGMEVLK